MKTIKMLAIGAILIGCLYVGDSAAHASEVSENCDEDVLSPKARANMAAFEKVSNASRMPRSISTL
jgi:hypothetical protein